MTPKQEIVSLGFIINSKTVTVNLTPNKRAQLRQIILDLLRIKNSSVRFQAKVIGTLISTFPASKLGPLYYRNVEKDKVNALNRTFGDYDSTVIISSESKLELEWWLNNIDDMSNWIQSPSITSEIYCDASNISWGTVFDVSFTGGAWNEYEFNFHIKTKEMLAIYFSVHSYINQLKDQHLNVFSDNTVAVTVHGRRSQEAKGALALPKTLMNMLNFDEYVW